MNVELRKILKWFIQKINPSVLSSGKLNVVKLSGGTAIGQGIAVLTIPIAARLFGATVIGDWAILYATASIVNAFSDLGLINAVMVSEDEKETKSIISLITLMGIFSATLVSLGFLFLHLTLSVEVVGVDPFFAAGYLFLIILLQQRIQLSSTWLNLHGYYKILMWNPVFTNGLFGVMSVVFGVLGFIEYGYFLALVIAQAAAVIHTKRVMPKTSLYLHFCDVKAILFKYKAFIKFQMPGVFAANVNLQLPVYLVKAFFGTEAVGYYSMTVKILQVPITFIGEAIGRVFYRKITGMPHNAEELRDYVYRNLNRLLWLAGIPMFFLVLFGDQVLNVVLGRDWEAAGVYVRILALQNMFLFIYTVFYGLPVVLHKQYAYLILNASRVGLMMFVAFPVGSYVFSDIRVALGLLSFNTIILIFIYISYLVDCIGINGKKCALRMCSVFLLILCSSLALRGFFYQLGLVPGM